MLVVIVILVVVVTTVIIIIVIIIVAVVAIIAVAVAVVLVIVAVVDSIRSSFIRDVNRVVTEALKKEGTAYSKEGVKRGTEVGREPKEGRKRERE